MQGSEVALFFFASYACQGETYGAKLLGTAKSLNDKDPRAGQVDQVAVVPSTGPVAAGGTRRLSQGGRSNACLMQFVSFLLAAR